MGYVFALACLVWVFHDVHPRRVLAQLTIREWAFLVPAVFFDILTYVFQGMRWSLLLRPTGRLSWFRGTQAIYAGLFTNEVLPLRVGEGVRAFLASRWINAPFRSVLPSMLVERLLDALCLLLAVAWAAIVAPLPKLLSTAGDVLGVIVLAGTAVFVLVVLRSRDADDPEHTSAIGRFVREMASGLRQIGLSRSIWVAFLFSAGLLLCQGLASWFMMRAFGLRLPLTAGFVVLFIIRLGTAIPNAPANVGTFQFFAVLGLSIYGIDKTTATAFSIVDFLVLTVPLWTLGLFAIFASGFSLRSLRTQAALQSS
ncbi:MAG TPA: lysylphosphatidylglycerol synthase transmembrane domain-containing protein [Terriglobales bacterium]|nr:lysylphosphatidylglycerol synthase transmembrane domain-containing protein [Terriglobales bacterium]